LKIDFQDLARQYSGRRLAQLILSHTESSSDDNKLALAGLMRELRIQLKEPVMELIDFLNSSSQYEKRQFFASDLGKQFLSIINVSKGFCSNKFQLQISHDEAFSIFNILIINWALGCQMNPQTKTAMQRSAGIGLIGRLLSRR
jgi:hypothetical protein